MGVVRQAGTGGGRGGGASRERVGSAPREGDPSAADRWVVDLRDLDATRTPDAGGKGAQLGALTRIDGVRVPGGFCVTTDAYARATADAPALAALLARSAVADATDREAVAAVAAELRRTIEALEIPGDVAAAIRTQLAGLGDGPVAVRSSATAEDGPAASFAGQHDTHLDVVGADAVLRAVVDCWASLFTEQAVAYRLRGGVDPRTVRMAVVVQRMVAPQASGVLFTADPATSERTVTAIEATRGLGEPLVSGRVDPDRFAVRRGVVTERSVGRRSREVRAVAGGGTPGAPRRERACLTDEQVLELARLGRLVEARLGQPQDIEWCLDGDGFALVQSRPITTLYPVPDHDGGPHVYVSVGHQQMMTDALRPLGLSVFRMLAIPVMHEAGGRLFVDVAERLASPATRAMVLDALGTSDPLIGDALRTLVDRGFVPTASPDDGTTDGASAAPPPTDGASTAPAVVADAAVPAPASPVPAAPSLIDADPARVEALVRRHDAAVVAAERAIAGTSGEAALAAVRADLADLRTSLVDPESTPVITAAMEASGWLNARLQEWLGEKHVADVLTRSVPHNVTSEMGLALLDVADVLRPHPAVVAALEHADDDAGLDVLDGVAGGREAREAITAFLDRYGARCVGEIDITRPRWSERPADLFPVLLGNVRTFVPGAGSRRFEEGRLDAWEATQDVLARLRALPDGGAKAEEAQRMIDRVRAFSGYREHPKFAIVRRLAVHRRALLAEADRLVRAGVLDDPDDATFLTFDELEDVVAATAGEARRSGAADDLRALVSERRATFAAHEALTPPRVITSDGEVVRGRYRRDDLPVGALAGLAVSAGTVEGRARVLRDPSGAACEPGDVLVTAFTDPSWTPLFVTVAALVTEAGGLMTHGAVIAREYGLPAVVGIERATELIRDGDRVRVHGTDGYVEVLARA